MPVFPSLGDAPDLAAVYRRFPASFAPLLEYHDRVLRDASPLTVAERELIAAYVSGLNACTYCHGSHLLAAQAFGIDPGMIEALLAEIDDSGVDAKLRPLLAYVAKLTRTPARLTDADAQAVYMAGWSEQALFDAISVCGLFNLMNRMVAGAGIAIDPLLQDDDDKTARAKRMATPGDDPHRAERSYSKLPDIWSK